jgi:hypothetical protein
MKQPLARLLGLAVLAAASLAVDARVVSYAPYTDRISIATFHRRTTRHFLVTELTGVTYSGIQTHEVVLYDAIGSDEPRVVYSSTERVRWAALWEDANEVPRILIAADGPKFWFSGDGGATIKRIGLPATTFLNVSHAYVDNGGPFTRGPYAPVRIGDAEFPFVVQDTDGQVWRVASDGTATAWMPVVSGNTNNAILGSDLTGTRFLLRESAGTYFVAGPDGRSATRQLPTDRRVHGWITPDGRVYLQSADSLWEDGKLVTTMTSGFAIPTSDYRGAWIVDNRAASGTTLMRHTPSGLETMWTDSAAPTIEALHAGASGDTLLVQVHRPRPQPDRIAITDPALAIWRVGQPAPKVYDELFLLEQPNKGFIHLEVDRVAGGDPFVFDSGVTIGLQVGASATDSGGGGDVLQEFGIVRASLQQQLVLPGVGRTLGANGSNWTTDVILYNPEVVPQKVELRFVPTGLDNALRTNEDPRTTITLNAKEIRLVRDVLATLFGRVDNGALFITPERTINATGRTYARVGTGTYGFGMTAVDVMSAASPRFPMTFVGAFPGPNFRTNVTLIDTAGRGSDASLFPTSASGLGNPEQVAFVPIAGQQQLNAVQKLVSSNDTGGLIIQPKRGFLVASVFAIDNITNDPTWFPADLPALTTRWIPVIGHVTGANGATFRTDLHIYNPAAEWRHVYLVAHPWDASVPAKQVTILMAPNESRVVRDAYATMFERTGVARLRYYSSNPTAGIRVTSRTYTTDAKGGTYGNLTPPLNGFQIASSGDALEILGVTGGAGHRTNLGIVEMHMWPGAAGDAPGSAKVEIIDNRGRVIDTFTVTVPLAGGIQLNDLFRSRGLGDGPEAALIRVSPERGQFATFATVTDNVTNDSIYLASYLKSQE